MKTFTLIFALLVSSLMSAQEVQLLWNKDLNIATEIAKSENKLILMYFNKSDCSACSQFYSDFFKNDAFKNVSDDFVLLMLDGSNTDINSNDLEIIKQRRMVNHYNKSLSFPAVLILDSERHKQGELLTATDEQSITNYLNFLQTLK